MIEEEMRLKALEMAIQACGVSTTQYVIDTANKFLDFIYNNEKITKEEKKQTLLEFCKYIMIDHPKHGVIPLELYDFQKDMLDKFQQKKSIITITHARQMGATTMLSIYALWYALYYDNSNIWLFNPKYDLAVNQLQIICEMLSNINDIDGYNKAINMISFKNGSRIFAGGISDTTYRGSTLDLAIIDNASQIPYSKDKKFIESIIPCCATSTNGSIILASTLGLEPKGLFHDMTKKHINYVYPWHLHPDRNEEWARPFRQSLGEIGFAREMECCIENSIAHPFLAVRETSKMLVLDERQMMRRSDIMELSYSIEEAEKKFIDFAINNAQIIKTKVLFDIGDIPGFSNLTNIIDTAKSKIHADLNHDFITNPYSGYITIINPKRSAYVSSKDKGTVMVESNLIPEDKVIVMYRGEGFDCSAMYFIQGDDNFLSLETNVPGQTCRYIKVIDLGTNKTEDTIDEEVDHVLKLVEAMNKIKEAETLDFFLEKNGLEISEISKEFEKLNSETDKK